jgi:hypothetical protein
MNAAMSLERCSLCPNESDPKLGALIDGKYYPVCLACYATSVTRIKASFIPGDVAMSRLHEVFSEMAAAIELTFSVRRLNLTQPWWMAMREAHEVYRTAPHLFVKGEKK